jgi:prolipoprotein diacylglyceryltransferase
MAALILGAVFLVDRTWWNRVPGMTFLLFIGLTAISRLLLEAFRGDSLLVGDGFRAAQLVAWIVLAVCLALIAVRFKSSATTKENGD